MNKYKSLVINIGLFAMNTISTKLITFLLVPLYTFYMTQAEYGITDMSVTVISLITPLATLSISQSSLRFALDKSDHKDYFITLGFVITSLSCVVVALMLPVLNLQVFGGLGEYKWLFLIAYTVNAFQLFFNDMSRALDEVKVIPIASAITAVLTGCSAVIFIAWNGFKVNGYFFSLIIGGISGIIVYLWLGKLPKHLIVLPPKCERKKYLAMMFTYAFPLIPNALFWWIGTSVNRFFITSVLGIAASGMFAAATKIPNMLNIVCSIFQQAWTLSAFQEYKNANISLYFSKIFRIFQSGIAISASLIIVLSPWLASLMLQKGFYDAWTLIPILIVAFYFNTMNIFFGSVYTASMKTGALFTTTIAGSIAVVIVTWILIKPLGLVGAGIAMAVSNAVIMILRMIGSRKLIVVHVRWATMVLTIGLLIVQSVLIYNQVQYYMLYAITICIAIIVIESSSLLPIVRLFLNRRGNESRFNRGAVGSKRSSENDQVIEVEETPLAMSGAESVVDDVIIDDADNHASPVEHRG